MTVQAEGQEAGVAFCAVQPFTRLDGVPVHTSPVPLRRAAGRSLTIGYPLHQAPQRLIHRCADDAIPTRDCLFGMQVHVRLTALLRNCQHLASKSEISPVGGVLSNTGRSGSHASSLKGCKQARGRQWWLRGSERLLGRCFSVRSGATCTDPATASDICGP